MIKKRGVQPPGSTPRDASKDQSPQEAVKPKINFFSSEKLYKKIKQKKLGSGPGLLRIDKNLGILINPRVLPTEVMFEVSDNKETLKRVFG